MLEPRASRSLQSKRGGEPPSPPSLHSPSRPGLGWSMIFLWMLVHHRPGTILQAHSQGALLSKARRSWQQNKSAWGFSGKKKKKSCKLYPRNSSWLYKTQARGSRGSLARRGLHPGRGLHPAPPLIRDPGTCSTCRCLDPAPNLLNLLRSGMGPQARPSGSSWNSDPLKA